MSPATRHTRARLMVLAAAALAGGCGSDSGPPEPETLAGAAAQPDGLQRYDTEYPVIDYTAQASGNRVAALAQRMSAGEIRLAARPGRGYLDDLLEALDIDTASQVLVFSKTSQQVEGISAATPRAIYFNDDTYVAWVPDAASLELGALDTSLGPVFYTMSQDAGGLERRLQQCLSCHDSYSLTGGGVPRMITGSGYIGKDGTIVAHEGWVLTSDRTPLRSRWGGWYVSGLHGSQVHLGNIAVDSVYDLEDLEALRNGNHADLDELLNVTPYPAATSDIVALLVLEHQVTVQNAIVRLGWDYRQAVASRGLPPDDPGVTAADLGVDIEPLVAALVLAGTPVLSDPITGTAGFERSFAARRRADSAGRSLRDFDLETRLFRYPLSYIVHSEAFAALPSAVIGEVLVRVGGELTGQDARLDDLPGDAASRLAAWEIFLETRTENASVIAAR